MTIGNRLDQAMQEAHIESQSALARASGVPQATISRILKGGGRKGPETETVRKLAAACNVSFEWLNEGLGEASRVSRSGEAAVIELNSNITPHRRSTDLQPGPGQIVIPQFRDVAGSMGNGILLRDQPGEIQGWRVTDEWVNKNVKNHTGTGNLRIVTGFGDSMRPLYNPGDPLLVDAGVRAVEFDSIYFFRIGDEGFIKRLQRVPGQGLLAISENKSYRDWVITSDMDFEVFARVIKIWSGSDF